MKKNKKVVEIVNYKSFYDTKKDYGVNKKRIKNC